MPGLLNVTVFVSPLASPPVLHSPTGNAVASCGMSPTLLNVTVVPVLIRVRAGAKEYSVLPLPILIASAPTAIGPTGPAMFGGGGGGHNGLSWPLSENTQTASPYELPCSWLPPVAIAMY